MVPSKRVIFNTPQRLIESIPSRRIWIRNYLKDNCQLGESEYRLDLLVGEVIPYIDSPEGMAAQSLLVAFLYTYDRVDMSSTAHARALDLDEVVVALKALLRGKTGSMHRYDWYGAALLEKLCSAIRGDSHFDLFRTEMERFLDVTLVERENRLHCRIPSVQEYFEKLRDDSCGVGPCVLTAVMFHPERHTLTADFWSTEAAREMLTLCKRIISIHNDVFGYDREKAAGDVNNFVISLSEQMNERNALKSACSIADGMYSGFFDLRASAGRKGLSALWDACHCWIVGNWIWSTNNSRRFSDQPGPVID